MQIRPIQRQIIARSDLRLFHCQRFARKERGVSAHKSIIGKRSSVDRKITHRFQRNGVAVIVGISKLHDRITLVFHEIPRLRKAVRRHRGIFKIYVAGNKWQFVLIRNVAVGNAQRVGGGQSHKLFFAAYNGRLQFPIGNFRADLRSVLLLFVFQIAAAHRFAVRNKRVIAHRFRSVFQPHRTELAESVHQAEFHAHFRHGHLKYVCL